MELESSDIITSLCLWNIQYIHLSVDRNYYIIIIIIYMCFSAVLPAGTVVMARSPAVASAHTVPLSDDCHLHRPEPHI